MKTLLTLLLLAAPIATTAQTITLDGGRTTQVVDFAVERENATGIATLLLRLTPDFDPEPFGPVPPTDAGRDHLAICQQVAPANAALMAEHNATRFAVRWDWTPVEQDADFTISRFHRNAFDVLPDGKCQLVIEMGEQFPPPLSGATPRLMFTQTTADQRMSGIGLELVYDWGTPLSDDTRAARSQAAIELCLTVVEQEMRRRQASYRDLRYDYLAVVFEETPTPGNRVSDRYVYALDGSKCVSDLPQMEINAIRAAAR